MSGYQAKPNNNDSNQKNNNNINQTNNNNDKNSKNNASSLKENIQRKGASMALQAMGVPKPLADIGAKMAQKNNMGKLPNPAQVAKQHQSKKKNESEKNDNEAEKEKTNDNSKNHNKLDKAGGKLGKAKEGINNLKNLDEDASVAKIAITFAKTVIAVAPIALIFLPFLLILIVIAAVEVVYGSYNTVDNLFKLEPINASIGGGTGTNYEFYAPVQGISNISFGNISETSGCNNNVSHDASNIPEGTILYAGIDGTAEYIQITCGDVLYSYGNEVKITASDGTYIIYGHLKKFSDDIAVETTTTCAKKGNTPPCPSSNCSGGVTRKVISSKPVKKGDVIGQVGNTGNSTGTHLHVEIHKSDNIRNCVIDPWNTFGLR